MFIFTIKFNFNIMFGDFKKKVKRGRVGVAPFGSAF